MHQEFVGMKPLSERDENNSPTLCGTAPPLHVGMKPLSERDENLKPETVKPSTPYFVGMKPLSERDENSPRAFLNASRVSLCRNEATL